MEKASEVYTAIPHRTRNVSQHILMLRPDILNRYSDFHFAQTAIAFQNYGHRVTIITCTKNPQHYQNELRNVPVIQTATWFPKSICGYLKYFMYVLRSFGTALQCVFYPLSPRPSVIFCNTSCIAIPILYFFGQNIILHLQNPFELLKMNNKQNDIFNGFKQILKQSLLLANLIMVPDVTSHKIFNNTFTKYNGVNAVVTYPCVDINLLKTDQPLDIRSLIPELPSNCYLFVSFGEYLELYNFQLVLHGFVSALQNLNQSIAHRMHLVIAANFDETIIEHRLYYKLLSNTVNIGEHSQHITLLKKVTIAEKKCLMYEATAILHTSGCDVFCPTVLECMFFGKVVIALNRGFAKDVLVDQVTGFLLPSEPKKFAEIIQKLITNKILSIYMGSLAETEFKYRYSSDQYAKFLNNFIATQCINFCCLKHCYL